MITTLVAPKTQLARQTRPCPPETLVPSAFFGKQKLPQLLHVRLFKLICQQRPPKSCNCGTHDSPLNFSHQGKQ